MKRIKAAFKELNSIGIVSEMNFACCQTCGLSEIDDSIFAAQENGITCRGYCFYHGQDAYSLRIEGNCCLCFGLIDEIDGADSSPIGAEIVSILNKHGIKTEWNGQSNTRITMIRKESK